MGVHEFSGLFLAILLILSITSIPILALDCQYTAENGFVQFSRLYVDDELQENPLEVRNFRTNGCSIKDCMYVFDVYNFLDIPVNVTIQFESFGNPIYQDAEIQPYSISSHGGGFNTAQSSIKFTYHSNRYSEARYVNEPILVCRECEGGLSCLNDGESCNLGSQCGGGYCVEGRCNYEPYCYQNNCGCPDDKIECPDHSQCVIRDKLSIGKKPICDARECITNYINPKTGLCSVQLGGNCNENSQCPSGYCIRGCCSETGLCCNNDCNCSEDEIQCSDNKTCVKKNEVSLGSKPACNIEECKSETYKNITRKYLDGDGNCAEHPDITNARAFDTQRNWLILIGVFIGIILIIFMYGMIVYFKNKSEFEDKINKNKKDILNKLHEQKKELEQVLIKRISIELAREKEKQVTLDKSIEKIKQENENIRISIQSLDELRLEIKKAMSKKNKESADYRTIRTLKEQEQEKLSIIRNTYDTYKDAVDIFKIDMDELERRKLSLEKDIMDLDKNKIKSLEEINTLAEKKKEAEDVNKKLKKASSEFQRMMRDLTSINEEIVSKEKELFDIQSEVSKIQREYIKLKNELDIIKSKKEKSKSDLEDIARMEIDLQRKEKVIADYTKIEKSHILGSGVYQWRNPKKEYYPCYVNKDAKGDYTRKTDTEIHKDLAKRIYNHYSDYFKKRYPEFVFDQMIVHHIDDDPDNYNEDNLAIISWDEHNSKTGIQHKHILRGDRDSGIKELNRLNIKQPHIPELNK
ncbi:MAG: hypothetical protein ACP5NV_05065 [Candidatus Woesearchaeota archaeon]